MSKRTSLISLYLTALSFVLTSASASKVAPLEKPNVANVAKFAGIEEGQSEVTFTANIPAGKYDMEA